MKPGDKVWVFDDDQFKQVDYVCVAGREVLVDNDTPFLYYPKYWYVKEKPHFPTREALCEHYRKIFE